MRTGWIALPLLLASTVLYAQQAQWGYEGKKGPANWARLDPAYIACQNGKMQSPTDIHKARRAKLPPLEFHYMSSQPEIVNDGHSIKVHFQPGSYFLSGGHRYDLVEMHFHHPGEQAVEGHLSDMELHLVHKDAEGKFAILSVRLNETQNPNAVLAGLWQVIPRQTGQKATPTDFINPRGLLPASLAYWTYSGSLTEPPCTEGVEWFVFQQQVEISREQVRAFSNLYPRNARPLQPAHERKILSSE